MNRREEVGYLIEATIKNIKERTSYYMIKTNRESFKGQLVDLINYLDEYSELVKKEGWE